MITHAAAKQLRTLITRRCTAERNDEMRGAQPPEDAEIIRLELENAQQALDRFIDQLTARAS